MGLTLGTYLPANAFVRAYIARDVRAGEAKGVKQTSGLLSIYLHAPAWPSRCICLGRRMDDEENQLRTPVTAGEK